MVNCCVLGCKSHSAKREPGVTFHRFPIDVEKRNIWVANMKMRDFVLSKNDRLCSLHFEAKCFYKTASNKTRLLNEAVPTIFPTHPKQRRKRFRPATPKPGPSSASTEVDIETPRKKKLKRQLIQVKLASSIKSKKLKVRGQLLKRCKKKVVCLKQLLRAIKEQNLITAENVMLLENMTNFNKEMLKRKIGKKVKYSPEVRKFALTLHFLSPKAYDYVRRVFDTCLPHSSTIGKWLKSIDAKPGFTEEALRALKNKVQISTKPLFCALIIDEMSIRKQLEWDGKQYHGYITLGIELNDDTTPLAKEAFVLMVCCINGTWKIPMGYFLTDSLNGSQKAQLVTNAITLLQETGINIISLTFDGAASNICMGNTLLGSVLTVTSLNTYFTYGGQNIYLFYDPCHMVKLIRNTFGERKCFIDGNGDLIDWKYVEMLEELQRNEGLHLGNKLRLAHINFVKQKMKVRLAVQLLSASVADALEYCKDKLKLDEFQNCAGTIKFIRMMNNIFDILNSRTLVAFGFKKALCSYNINNVKLFVNDAINYICNLRLLYDNTLLIHSNRKIGFIGLIICLRSSLRLYDELVGDNKLIYFPVYKISQDHLELFFSSIRSRGGWNNNPTARQFSAAYKRLLIRSEIREGGVGNCIPLEQLPILVCSSRTDSTSEENINRSVAHFKDQENEKPEVEEIFAEHNYIMNTNVILSACSYEIVVYIAGFVTRSLSQKLKCEQCISSLIGQKENYLHSLITQKTGGGLMYPSEDVIKICQKCEIYIRMEYDNLHLKNSFLNITNKVVGYFVGSNIFKSLKTHVLENECNHMYFLIKGIATKYLNIRYHFIAKRKSEKIDPVRSHLTKMILFQGQ